MADNDEEEADGPNFPKFTRRRHHKDHNSERSEGIRDDEELKKKGYNAHRYEKQPQSTIIRPKISKSIS